MRFYFLIISLSAFGIMIALSSLKEFKSIPSSKIFGSICEKLVSFLSQMFSRIHQQSYMDLRFLYVKVFNYNFNLCNRFRAMAVQVIYFILCDHW